MRNEVTFVTTTRCHLKEIGHKTKDRRNLSPNTSHIVPLDHKGKGHHDQDHKDKGWYDPVKAPFQECQVVDSCLRANSSIKSAVIKNPEKVKKISTPMKPPGKAFGRNGKAIPIRVL